MTDQVAMYTQYVAYVNDSPVIKTITADDTPVIVDTPIIVYQVPSPGTINSSASSGRFFYATTEAGGTGYKYYTGSTFRYQVANMTIPAGEKLEFIIHDPIMNLSVSSFNDFVPISSQTLNSRDPTDFNPVLVTEPDSVVRINGTEFHTDVTLYYVRNGWYVSAIFWIPVTTTVDAAQALLYIGSKLYVPPDHFASYPNALGIFNSFQSDVPKNTLYEIRPDENSNEKIPDGLVYLADII